MYDKLVVDPMTNDIYEGKPWFLFFYVKKCRWCSEFKPYYEDYASRMKDIANFGMINGHECELIKETFNINAYPTLLLLKDGIAYQYEGTRLFESIRAFILRDHIYTKK